MPTTRSATKKQAKLEDFTDVAPHKQPTNNKKVDATETPSEDEKTASNSSAKRKSASRNKPEPASSQKKQKQKHFSSDNIDALKDPIVINRAPVLQLWGAVVAQFLHSDLSWPACLSVGNAISSLCAISKGKAIGVIEPKDDPHAADHKGDKETKDGTQKVIVMGFPLHLDGDAVVMSGKPTPFNESTLRNKFGHEQYDATKQVMSEALHTWTDDTDDLNKKAFHMYEKFRPNVASGQRGWGRKGELNLHEVKSTIVRPPNSG